MNGVRCAFGCGYRTFCVEIILRLQTDRINPLLMLVMFGMELTFNLKDFALVFTNPKYVIIGRAAQFIVMPFISALAGFYRKWEANAKIRLKK